MKAVAMVPMHPMVPTVMPLPGTMSEMMSIPVAVTVANMVIAR